VSSGGSQMYHIVYLTTNLINNKIYVGVHSTFKLEDGYLGSGKLIRRALDKYGELNFKRQILHYCLEESNAYELEEQIVDQWFINRKDTYNIICGGKGGTKGFKHSDITKQIISDKNRGKTHITTDEVKLKMSQSHKNLNYNGKNHHLYGKKLSEERLYELKTNILTEDRIDIQIQTLKDWRQNNTNPNSKMFYIVSPEDVHYKIYGNLRTFCSEHNLVFSVIYKNIDKGKILLKNTPKKSIIL
jgi:group I intron endonuclease